MKILHLWIKRNRKENVERCVVCGAKTEYTRDIPIVQREGYIEGAGQLCRKCYESLYGKKSAAYSQSEFGE